MGAPDFKDIAARALAISEVLLPEWLAGGRRVGREWQGCRRINGGPGDSWSVNMDTGKWLHGADPGVQGGDLVSLYAALHQIDQLPALKEVAKLIGHTDAPVKRLPSKRPAPELPDLIPDDAPPIPAHHRHGKEAKSWQYGHAFVVARYEFEDGSKSFAQVTWRDGRWQFFGYPGLRPIYGLELLRKRSKAPVLVVEGEKCADAARAVLAGYVVVTWAGGAQAIDKSDWSVLSGRDVVIWPDNDAAGFKAAASLGQRLSDIAMNVRIVRPNGEAPGWDVADAIARGWNAHKITEWAATHMRDSKTVANATHSPPAVGKPHSIEPGELDNSPLVRWDDLRLDKNQGGVPFPTLANASRILQLHPKFKGHVWYDEFTQKIYQNIKGPTRQWRDEDDEDLTVFIQQSLSLSKFNLKLIGQSVRHAARQFSRNSLQDWLSSLHWDGVERLDTWLGDTLGVDLDEYTMAVSRNWPISMVARAFVPGCQVDTMPVLEGATGQGKSSFVNILGSPWYASLPESFGTKDFLQAVQGRWLIEIPDMTGFSHREHTHILATITNRTDVYRASYGHYVEEHPRSCVFAATSETDDYLQDIRGRRRYWPLRCKDIQLEVLAKQRDHVFAEAVARYKSGATWYEMPAQADAEQRERASPDLWSDRVLQYVDTLVADGQRVTSAHILQYAIEMPLAKQGQLEKNRIARIMREAGWIPTRTKDIRHWIKPIRKIDDD
jgi:predicted P-loop ATPase